MVEMDKKNHFSDSQFETSFDFFQILGRNYDRTSFYDSEKVSYRYFVNQ